MTGPLDPSSPTIPLTFTFGILTNLDIFYFNVPCMLHMLLIEKGEMDKDTFRTMWTQIPDTNEMHYEMTQINTNYI